MGILKYMLLAGAFAMFGTTVGVVGYDVWLSTRLQHLLGRRIPHINLEGFAVRPR
jgi:hypothetical protein